MHGNSLIAWLFSEAGAGWVFGIISSVLYLISRLRKIKPARATVREIRRIEPIKVRPSIKNKVVITFGGNEIEKLAQYELEIYNEGHNVINDGQIKVILDSKNKILDVSCDDKEDNIETSFSDNEAIIKWKYLNPFREHKQKNLLSIIFSGDAKKLELKGSGKGWSAHHITIYDEEKKMWRISFISIPLFMVFLTLNGFLVKIMYGIGFSEISFRAFVAYLPTLIILSVVTFWFYRKIRLLEKEKEEN